ncbi:hypothetical protein GCM10007079_21380 [Nocardiopsis terrae]|nr:hypothetical protein GCM10007079_21380 [Nocardiopsis terrae]
MPPACGRRTRLSPVPEAADHLGREAARNGPKVVSDFRVCPMQVTAGREPPAPGWPVPDPWGPGAGRPAPTVPGRVLRGTSGPPTGSRGPLTPVLPSAPAGGDRSGGAPG